MNIFLCNVLRKLKMSLPSAKEFKKIQSNKHESSFTERAPSKAKIVCK